MCCLDNAVSGKGKASDVNPYRTDLDIEESDRRIASVLESFVADKEVGSSVIALIYFYKHINIVFL